VKPYPSAAGELQGELHPIGTGGNDAVDLLVPPVVGAAQVWSRRVRWHVRLRGVLVPEHEPNPRACPRRHGRLDPGFTRDRTARNDQKLRAIEIPRARSVGEANATTRAAGSSY